MYKAIPYASGELVLGFDSMNFQEIVDDFSKAKTVRVLTYNISKNNYQNRLMDALKGVAEDADVKIITNIPSRMPTYYNCIAGESMRNTYRKSFTAYLNRLNPENFQSEPDVSFCFDNHAKIIGTENILYIGSANFSDESSGNFESGTIIRDKDIIAKVYEEFFPELEKDAIPYFDDEFNVFRLFVLSMLRKFEKWLEWFDGKIIWKSEKTGIKGLYDPIGLDEDDLFDLNCDLDEIRHFVSHLKDTYSDTDEEYNGLIERLLSDFEAINIQHMFDLTCIDTDLFELVRYDLERKTNEYLQSDPDAYDENLELSVEAAEDRAKDEYEDLRTANENDLYFIRDGIEKIVRFLDTAHSGTLEFFNKWITKKIDNT